MGKKPKILSLQKKISYGPLTYFSPPPNTEIHAIHKCIFASADHIIVPFTLLFSVGTEFSYPTHYTPYSVIKARRVSHESQTTSKANRFKLVLGEGEKKLAPHM